MKKKILIGFLAFSIFMLIVSVFVGPDPDKPETKTPEKIEREKEAFVKVLAHQTINEKVKPNLHVPTSLEIPTDNTTPVFTEDSLTYSMNSEYSAKNRLGVLIRTRYKIQVEFPGGDAETYILKSFDIEK